MMTDQFAQQRDEEERLQREQLKRDNIFFDLHYPVKEVIKNPDITMRKTDEQRAKEASCKIAEFELLRLKNELLSGKNPEKVDHKKIAEILQRLM